jgi:AcrR family transcriptional regulator
VTAPSPVNDENARCRRALRTAEELFKKVGFRAVTMELVAREANVAKATLYSYFKNKDELYLAVCGRMAGILRGAVETALATPHASLDARLTAAAIAKQRPIFALVRGSAHAAELFSYTHSLAAEIFCELDRLIIEMLRAAMADDPQLAPNATQLARTLYFGSGELARRSATAADMEADLGAFAAAYLLGVRALAKKSSPGRPMPGPPMPARRTPAPDRSARGGSAPPAMSAPRRSTKRAAKR